MSPIAPKMSTGAQGIACWCRNGNVFTDVLHGVNNFVREHPRTVVVVGAVAIGALRFFLGRRRR